MVRGQQANTADIPQVGTAYYPCRKVDVCRQRPHVRHPPSSHHEMDRAQRPQGHETLHSYSGQAEGGRDEQVR